MGKRKRRQRADLPLFDLPLNPSTKDGDGGPEILDNPAELELEPSSPEPASDEVLDTEREPRPPREPKPAREPRSSREPGRSLFEPAESKGSAELDRVDLGPGEKPTPSQADPPAEGRVGEDATDTADPEGEDTDTRALLGDRLLAGLADLAVQVLMLGLAIAACYLMGIGVTFADWQPFSVLVVAFSFLYWVVPLAFWGQTPGMAWVGHTARSSSGEPLTFGQTSRRWLGAVLTLALAGLPLLLTLTGRSLTDRLSDSTTRGG